MPTDPGKSSTPASKTIPPPNRLRRLARRGIMVLAALLILAIAVFFLVPVWISNDQGRTYVLDRLNRALNGPRVAMDQWSLGWFHATEIKNLRIYQPDGTQLLSCPAVSSGLTLWDLVRGNYDIGQTLADNLDMRIVKYDDGTTSLHSFAQAAGDVLSSARGALQINHAHIEFASQKTGESLTLSDVQAAITIAWPDTPFHVQVSATSPAGANMSLNAAFPPTRTLINPRNLGEFWPWLTDVDFVASHLPARMLCDYADIDPAWADSLGNSIDALQISAHPAAQAGATHLNLLLHAASAGPISSPQSAPSIDARLLLQTESPPGATQTATLAIPSADFHVNADLRFSAPLSQALGRINPILAEATTDPRAAGTLVHLEIRSLSLPLENPRNDQAGASASARLAFPPLLFTARNGPSMVRQLQVVSGDLPQSSTSGPPAQIPGTADPLHLSLADGQFSYDNFLVRLGHNSINFSGGVGLDGSVHLIAEIPSASAGLSAGSAQVEIGGTVDSPLVKHAE